MTQFKWQIAKNDGGVWGNDPDGTDDTFVLRSTEQTVDGRWNLDDPALRKLSKGEKADCLLAVGDLVVTKSSGSSLHIGKTTIVTPDVAKIGCCYSNFMQRIRVAASFDARLAWYIMNNEVARRQFDLISNSTTGLANLNGTMIGQILVTVPPTNEQVSIIDFLDRETAKLDALITEQRTLIDLLKEKRQAVISHAVTNGLDPDVAMKDSGVEWLGEVPAHWEILRLKQVIKEGSSISYGIVQPGDPQDFGIPFVQTTNMTSGAFDLEGLQKTTKEIEALYPRSRLIGGEVILGIRASIGSAYVVLHFLAGANLSRGVARICCDKNIFPEFLVDVFASRVAENYWQLLKQGSTFNEVSIETVREFCFAFPSLEEQMKIHQYLDEEKARLEALTAEAETTIALLQERRSALISAAVTGKIDVRQAA